MPYFGLQNKPKNANYASSAFFRKIMKIVLVMANYAKIAGSAVNASVERRQQQEQSLFSERLISCFSGFSVSIDYFNFSIKMEGFFLKAGAL